jgi:hypothetical protein
MKARFLLCLLLVPSLCLAALTTYQENVVKIFAAGGADQPLREAYEAQAAGTATEVQKKVIRTSEMIYEDLKLAGCVQSALGADVSLDAAIAKVVAAGKGDELIADAKLLFGQGEWETGVSANDTPAEQAVEAAALLSTGSKPQEGDAAGPGTALRALQRRMTLEYYLSFATEGKCKPSPQVRTLLGKAGG